MVPDLPSIGRRKLLRRLGAGAAALAGGTVAVGATEPTALPDPVTDEATKHFPTPPEVATLWRPTVTEAHAREAVDLLAETSDRAEALWPRLDLDEPTIHDPPAAGGWLESARESLANGNYPKALFRASYGMQFAGGSLGFARATLGRADRDRLADRGTRLVERSRAVAADLDPYPTVDPARDLGWYVRIEQELQTGGFRAAQGVPDDVDAEADGSPDPQAVAELTGSLLQAELHLRSAERYRDLLQEKLSGSTEPYAGHLREVADRFRADLEPYPTRDEVLARYVGEDVEEYGPWEFAHARLARWCFDASAPVPTPWEVEIDDDLLALRTVALSIGLAKRRGHGLAVDRLVVERDDTGFDSGHTLAAKRRARSTYRSVVGDDPSPLLVTQIGRAVEDLQVAKVGFAGEYATPMWRERLKPYLYALIGRAKLEQYPALRDAVLGRA